MIAAGQAWDSPDTPSLCRGSSRCHARGGPGGERPRTPGLEREAGVSRGSEEPIWVISQEDGGTGAAGRPTPEAAAGEGKEDEAQRGPSSCRLMREGWTRGGTAAHRGTVRPHSRPRAPHSGATDGVGSGSRPAPRGGTARFQSRSRLPDRFSQPGRCLPTPRIMMPPPWGAAARNRTLYGRSEPRK